MADRIVSWKVVADFAAVRKEAESARKSIDDLRESEVARDKESRDRQRKRAADARKTAPAAGGKKRDTAGGDEYADQLKSLRSLTRALKRFSATQKDADDNTSSLATSLGKVGAALREYKDGIGEINQEMGRLSRQAVKAQKSLSGFQKSVEGHERSLATLRGHYAGLREDVDHLQASFANLSAPLDNVLTRLQAVRDEARGLRELDTALSRTLSRTTALSRAEAEQAVERNAKSRRAAAQGAPRPVPSGPQGAPRRDRGGDRDRKKGPSSKILKKGFAGAIPKKLVGMAALLATVLNQVSAAAVSLGAGLAGLASSAGYAASALLGLAPAASALVLVFGALFTSFKGVGGALGAYAQKQKQAESGQNKAAKSARARQKAEEDLADTIRDNARAIEDAEDRVTAAYLGSRRAQEALTRARKEATIQLRELREEVDSLALSEEEAMLDLEDARISLAATMADPGASASERRRAEIAVRRAEEALRDARQEREQANDDLAQARDKGIENSDEVVDAVREEYDANKELKRSLEDLEQAFVDADRAVRDATDGMADAVAAGVDPFAAAMKKLPAEAQKLVNVLIDLKDEWEGFQAAVANATLPGFVYFFQNIVPVMNAFEDALVAVGGSISDFMIDVTKMVGSGPWLDFFRFMGNESAKMVDVAGAALLNYADGLRYMMVALTPLTHALMRMGEEWSNNFKLSQQFAAEAGKTFDTYDKAQDSFKLFAEIVGNLWEALRGFGRAFAGVGQQLLNGIANLTTKWVVFINSVEGSDAIETWANQLMPTLRALGTVFETLFVELGKIANVGAGSAPVFLYQIAGALEGLSDLIQKMAPLGESIGAIIFALGEAFLLLAEHGGYTIKIISDGLTVVLKLFTELLSSEVGVFVVKLALLAVAFSTITKVVGFLIVAVGKLGRALMTLVKNPVMLLIAAFILFDSTTVKVIAVLGLVVIALYTLVTSIGAVRIALAPLWVGFLAAIPMVIMGIVRVISSFYMMAGAATVTGTMITAAFFGIPILIGLIVAGISWLVNSIRGAREEHRKLVATMTDKAWTDPSGVMKLSSEVDRLTGSTKEFRDQVEATSLSVYDYYRMVEAQLSPALTDLAYTYDTYEEAVANSTVALTDQEKEQLKNYYAAKKSSEAIAENGKEAAAASEAYENLTAKLRGTGNYLKGEFAENSDEAYQSVLDLAKAAGITQDQFDEMNPRELALAIDDYRESVQYATQAERDQAEALAVLGNKYSGVVERGEAYTKMLNAMNSEQRDAFDSAKDYADSMDDLGEAIKGVADEQGNLVPVNLIDDIGDVTAAAKGSADSMQKLSSEQRELIASTYDIGVQLNESAGLWIAQGDSVEVANGKFQDMRNDLVEELLPAFEGNRAAVEDFITVTLGIPTTITTTIGVNWASGTPAEIKAQLDAAVAEEKAIKLKVLGADGTSLDAYVLTGVSRAVDASNAALAGQPVFIQVEGKTGHTFRDPETIAAKIDELNRRGVAYDVVVAPTYDGKPMTDTAISNAVNNMNKPEEISVTVTTAIDAAKAHDDAVAVVEDVEKVTAEADPEIKIVAKNQEAKVGVQSFKTELDKIPEKKTTQIVAYVHDAHVGVQNYVTLLGTIPEKKTTQIVAYVADARKGIQAYLDLLGKIKPKYTSSIVAYVADAKKGVDNFLTTLNKIKPTYEVEFFARNVQRATALVDTFRESWDKITNKAVTLTVTYVEKSPPTAGAKGGQITYAGGGVVMPLSRASGGALITMSRHGPGGSLPGRYAGGGKIRGPGGPKADKIPAWLSNGEYVVNSGAASKFLPLLEFINSSYAAGGKVTPGKMFAVGGQAGGAEAIKDTVKSTDPAVRDWVDNMETMGVASEGMTETTADSFNLFVDTTKESMVSATKETSKGLAALNTVASAGMTAYLNTTKTVLGQVTQAWGSSAVGIGAAWGPISQNVAGPAKFVVNTVMNEGVIKSMNTLLKFLEQPTVTPTPVKFARGGHVPGHGNRDSVPAMLTPGEYVIKKSAARALGKDYLSGLNHYASGGEVTGTSNPDKVPANDDAMGRVHPTDPMALFAKGFVSGMKDLIDPTKKQAMTTLTGSDYMHMLRVLSLKALDGTSTWAGKMEKKFGSGSLVDNAFVSSGSGWPPPNTKGNAANTAAAIEFTKRTWPVSSVGGWRASGSVATSDHPKGKAMDIMLGGDYRSAGKRTLGNQIAKWYVDNPKNFGTKYVIYYDQVNSGKGWKPYKHPSGSNDTLQHRDHVHVSLFGRGGQAGGRGGVPSMLTPGEFVIPRGMASAIGPSGLSALNRGKPLGYRRGGGVRRFHKGGPVEGFGGVGTGGRRFRGIKAQMELFNMIGQWTNDLSDAVNSDILPKSWDMALSNTDRQLLDAVVWRLNQAAVPGAAGTGGQSSYPGHLISRRNNPRAAQVKSIQAKVGVKQDGIFGPVTESGVKAWQRDKALRVDGIVGPQTWNSLFPPTAGVAAGTAGDKSVYNPATMAAKLGISVGTLLRIWKNGSETITEGVQEANRQEFWNNMKTLDATFADDLKEVQTTLKMPVDGLWSATMDESVAHALYHGMGKDHERWMARSWDPLTPVEEEIKKTEEGNALRKDWDTKIGRLYSWGLAYLVQDLKNKGISDGMTLATSAVGNRGFAEELDKALRESGTIKLESLTEEGYLPIWALVDFINTSDRRVGLRDISARFGMPDYKAYRSVDDLRQSLSEQLTPEQLQYLFDDLERFRTGTYYMSQGGVVPGRGNGDSVPTMLSPGEYVLKKEVARALGLSFLDKINSGVSLTDLVQLPTGLNTPIVNPGKVPNLERTASTTITTTNNFNTTINNPVAERGSVSLSRNLRQKAALGVFGTTQEGV